jgi:mono/diheme cytochrome c family protein
MACKDIDAGTSCTDVTTYWQAMRLKHELDQRLLTAPDNRLLAGERLARKLNCFQCHGELGQGGLANAGALKAYVPGYFGRDFRSLTDGGRREVVREWIATGSATVVTDHPLTGSIARLFLERQATSMPSFSSLPPGELDLLVNYVIALHGFGPLDAQSLKRYASATVAQ